MAIMTTWQGSLKRALREVKRALTLSKNNPTIATAKSYVLACADRHAGVYKMLPIAAGLVIPGTKLLSSGMQDFSFVPVGLCDIRLGNS